MYLIFGTVLLLALKAHSAAVSIPLDVVKKPAHDLVDSNGETLDVGRAAQLAQQGFDLSTLNPIPNKLWQNAIYSAHEQLAADTFPSGDQGVIFESTEASPIFTYMGRVQSATNPNQFYRFSLSRYTHAVLLRAALLRKLGYYVPSPKFYNNLKVHFHSLEQMNAFIQEAEEATTSDFDSRGWVKSKDEKQFTVTFSNAMLEIPSNDYIDIQWGLAPNPRNPRQVPLIQRYSRHRAYRALIVPYALADIPESINRYSPKFASVFAGQIIINHPAAESFAACTYEDAKWLLRRLATLTEQDFSEVVNESYLPEELKPLVLAKLILRSKNALEFFKLSGLSQLPTPSLKINSPSGLVKNGQVQRELIEGYPQRFSHGQRQSPYQEGDIKRYLKIDTYSTAISEALTRINEQLEILSTSSLFEKRGQELQDRLTQHLSTRPDQPLYQQIESWGGPIAGFNVNSSRHITTGTYFESSAPVQLVDTLSVSGYVGYFSALDGIQNVMPTAIGNLSLTRSYAHVRPINSVEEGAKTSWKELYIPHQISRLAKLLHEQSLANTKNLDATINTLDKAHPLDSFLKDFKKGEVLVISDSIQAGLSAQALSPIDILMGISPFNFLNSVSLGVDASRVMLQQTLLTRTDTGIHLIIRDQRSLQAGASFDANMFLKILKARASQTSTNIDSQAFVIDYDPELGSMVNLKDPKNEKLAKLKGNLRSALLSLLKHNETEIFSTKFSDKKFTIEHRLNTKETQSSLFAHKSSSFKEDHRVKIIFPKNSEYPELNPNDEAVTLFAHRQGELVGRDLLGLAFDTIDGFLSKWGLKGKISRSSNPNPANTPFGRAYWRIVKTEADISSKREQAPTVASLEHVWGGWSLKRDKFIKLMEEISTRFNGTPVEGYRLIEKEAFYDVKKIDFYRVSAQLSLLPGGVDKIRALITQPDADPKKGKSLGKNVFAKFLGTLKGNKNYRAGDKELFNELIGLLGQGSSQQGLARYQEICQTQSVETESSPQNIGTWLYGSFYQCLTPWMQKLIKAAHIYPKNNKARQAKWTTEVLATLDEVIPLPALLQYLEKPNYVFFVRVNGFREGSEDGDLEFFGNTLGDPAEHFEYANGLMNYWAKKTRVLPTEIEKSQGSFR